MLYKFFSGKNHNIHKKSFPTDFLKEKWKKYLNRGISKKSKPKFIIRF